jgi:CheY-like chemotaxis protein
MGEEERRWGCASGVTMKINKVLLVDDDQNIRTVAELTLRMVAKVEVELAASGKEALLKALTAEPDVILLDVMMPGMDGPTTFAELRKIPSLENIPIIFMTAKVQKHEIEDYKKLSGANGVITKPFDPMTLLKEIQAIAVETPVAVAS